MLLWLLLLEGGRLGGRNVGEIVVELLGRRRRRAETRPPVSGQAGALHPPGPHVGVPGPDLHLAAARAAGLDHRGGGHQAARGLREPGAGRLLGGRGAAGDSISLEIGES